MRKFLSISFITLALFIAAGAAPAAHAGLLPEGNACPQGAFWISDHDRCEYDDWSPATLVTEDQAVAQATEATASKIANDKAAAGTPTSLTPPATYDFNGITVFIAQIFAWLLGVAAVTLDYAVYYTVVTMGNFVHNLTGVGIAWRVLRDIGNIVLIFGFLAIGITTILNVDWYGGGKKMLPMLLVAAVFLNFSLFISEAVIDTGNLFATQFYTQINGGQPAGNKLSASILTSVNQEGISNKIMSSLGLQTIYGDVRGSRAAEIFKNSWSVGFMSIVLFLVAAFVFFSLAFILIARFVILLFIIIIAPIGFAGLAIPQMKGTADKWWHTLFEQTITAPILLLLLYISILVITDAQFLIGFTPPGSTPSYTGYIDGNLSGFAGVILSFLVGMGLLLAVVIISKKLSAFGAAGATKLAGKLSGVSLAAAAPGWVGRTTVGMGANYAAKKLRDTKFGHSFVGRGIAGTLEKRVAGASFDVRNTTWGKSATGIGLDLGKGQTGGYNADLEERVKSYEKAAAGITGGAKEAAQEKTIAKQAKATMDAAREAHNKAQAEYNPVAEENARQKAETDRLKALDTANRNAGTPNFKVSQDLRDAQARLAASDAALVAENVKLAKARADFVARTKEEEAARKNIGAAKKQAQIEYGQRLEDVWGKIPIFGTAAAAAAGRVKGSAGKTKNQLAIEAFMVKAQEAAAAGGTTIPTATPPPATTPPPTGGAPHP